MKKQKQKKVDDQQFLEALDQVTKRLVYKFKFGYHEIEDMKQQAAVFAIEALDKYDHKRPLENFLWVHVRNRLFNFKRDNYKRPDTPCQSCPLRDMAYDSGCSKYNNKFDCELYSKWQLRNEKKKDLMHINAFDTNNTPSKHQLLEDVSNQEVIDILQTHLSNEARELFIRAQNGEKLKRKEQTFLQQESEKVIKKYGKNH